MLNKQCAKCHEYWPVSCYHKRALAKDGLDSWCKLCKKEYRHTYYCRNIEKEKARSRQKARHSRGLSITQNEYDNLMWDQQGLCLICETKPKTLVVDHDHTNGRIRGLLCHSCNIGLGLFKDDIHRLKRAIAYLT